MFRPFVIVVADDWDFRNCCRGALVAAGYRVATPTTMDAAEYFLTSVYPPAHRRLLGAGSVAGVTP